MKNRHGKMDFGADVSAAHLDIALHSVQEVQRIGNDALAIARWLKTLPKSGRLAMESTGSYHRLLAQMAHEHGLTVYVLNPRDIKSYARSLGQRGKTDRLDARVIARYVHHEHADLHAWKPPSQALQHLEDLLRQRSLLQRHYTAQKQALAQRKELKGVMAGLLQCMKASLDQLEKLIHRATQQLPQGAASMRSLMSIPGVGVLTAAALLRMFNRADNASADAMVALTGLDPRPMDSGKHIGVRRLSKRGDGETRRLLHNAAMAGCRTQTWKAVYERELAKGLPHTAALVALARRLVRVAYSLFKSGSTFEKSRVTA